MGLLDWLTLISYCALNIDVVLQIRRIRATKSSDDLSLPGMIIRYLAILVILVKFVSLKSVPLIAGQGLIAVTFSLYVMLALSYCRPARPARSKRKR